MGIIYKIISPSNKIYIGQTINNFEERIRCHKKKSTNCTLLKRAIDKYGIKMVYEVVETIPDELLDEREIYWIKYYNSLAPNGYNCSTGGNNKKELSDLLKDNISKGLRNNKINRDGYLGYTVKRKTGYVPVIKSKSKCVYLSRGAFNTEEEAIEVLKEYTRDPENFIKPDGTNKKREKREGCVFKVYNKWKVMYKHKYIGLFETRKQAEEHLCVILNK